ncbi:hypothetical protein ABH920_002993 [Catenulispora sp. EB89]
MRSRQVTWKRAQRRGLAESLVGSVSLVERL